ncbi:chorismate mutase [Bauldia sp.]|uniref:chorismate mutase n=1 Tax=Bauldia sp. TaxID=2575872 RepID=UPI003BAD9F55
MTDIATGNQQALTDLRGKIDAIDGEVHELLIDRAAVIDSLVRIKGTSVAANAFRPGREAAMMHRLVADHRGALPITTVEHIWREIITTFTRLQARFDVVIDASLEPEWMRDLARFHFGFSVNVDSMPDAHAVVARVAENGDLGIVGLDTPQSARAWWRRLIGRPAPKIMAHLPFILVPDRPADVRAVVIAPPLGEPTEPDLKMFAVSSSSPVTTAPGIAVLASQQNGDEWDTLVAVNADLDEAGFAARAAAGVTDVIEVGGLFRGIAVDTPPSLLYAGLGEADR